ncbi:MAG: S8 family serine peptidase, partial [Candidatus Hydrothermales bacterium]
MKKIVFLIFPILLIANELDKKLEPLLIEKIANLKDDEKVNCIFYLGPYDYDFIATIPDPDARVDYMKNIAFETQRPIVEFLISKGFTDSLIQLWISNKIAVKLPKYGIYEVLRNFPQIKYVYLNFKRFEPIPANAEPLSDFFPGEDYISGSIDNVRADEAWRRGYTGKGVVIGILDTGVDLNHPVLRRSYRGVSGWYDPISNTTSPNDPDGHGTGSLSLALGSHGIGVAPGAKWIASPGINGTAAQLSQCMQWFAGLPDSLRPHLVTNSWGLTTANDTTLWDEIRAWLLVGIIPVFAVGNEGPSASSTRAPGDFPLVFGVGGTYWPYDDVIFYSSRGPEPNSPPWNRTGWWPRTDWNRHKPDFLAPSEPTVAAAPAGEYQGFGGTSAACPHVAGIIALLLQANNFGLIRGMTGVDTSEIRAIYRFMSNNSYWSSSWGPRSNEALRDTFGWGRVDAEKYISNLPVPSTPNIFIDSVWVVNTTPDNDREIEPGETVILGIRVRNTGARATNATLRIRFKTRDGTNDATEIGLVVFSNNYGTLERGQRADYASFRISTTTALLENTTYYFTCRITADGGYRTYDFFSLTTAKREEAAATRSLRNDNGTAYYYPGNDPMYQNYRYFASKFELSRSGTMISCSIYTYNGSNAAVNCTLFVWPHNSENNAPGHPPIATRIISVGTAEQWYNFDIADIPGIQAGYIWVGVRKDGTTNNGVPYQDSDGASTSNKAT